jgi:hypothetical protein
LFPRRIRPILALLPGWALYFFLPAKFEAAECERARASFRRNSQNAALALKLVIDAELLVAGVKLPLVRSDISQLFDQLS